MAAEAGLGVIGVPTYCITPEHGPRVYFNTILTDAELEPDPRIEGWDPCEGCDECVRACPADAIDEVKEIYVCPSNNMYIYEADQAGALCPQGKKVIGWVERMVAESKQNAGPDIVNSPFLPFPEWMGKPVGEQDGGQD